MDFRIDRFTSKAEEFVILGNEDMKCKDCKYKLKSTANCKKYDNWKPDEVLDGGDCEYYEKE